MQTGRAWGGVGMQAPDTGQSRDENLEFGPVMVPGLGYGALCKSPQYTRGFETAGDSTPL